MSSRLNSVVVVGAGLAGVTTAETLRQEGFQGRISVFSDDRDFPYERPPLSKSFLLDPAASSIALKESTFFAENEIEVHHGETVTGLDLVQKRVVVNGRSPLGYDRLVIASGVSPRPIELAVAHEWPVFSLRTLRDATGLARRLHGGSLAVVGGGFIGLEVASTARAAGCDATVIEASPRILSRAVCPIVSDYLSTLHRRNGVKLLTGVTVAAIFGSASGVKIVLSDGSAVEAGTVVVGIGSDPNTALVKSTGLAVDDGILVNEFMQTADPNVYAAGDVARYWNGIHGQAVRVESWQNAERQGRAVARKILGKGGPYCETPWFWSDQFSDNLQMLGLQRPGAELIVRGDPESGRFSALSVVNDRIMAAAFVNEGRCVRPVRSWIDQQRPLDRERFRDTSITIQQALREPEQRAGR